MQQASHVTAAIRVDRSPANHCNVPAWQQGGQQLGERVEVGNGVLRQIESARSVVVVHRAVGVHQLSKSPIAGSDGREKYRPSSAGLVPAGGAGRERPTANAGYGLTAVDPRDAREVHLDDLHQGRDGRGPML